MGLVAILVLFDIFFYFSAMFAAALTMLIVRSPLVPAPLLALVLVGVAAGVLFFWLLSRYFRPIYYWLSRVMARFSWLAKRRYGLARTTVEFLHALRMLETMSWPERFRLYLLSVGLWLPRYLVLIVAVALVSRQLPADYLFLLQGLLNLGGPDVRPAVRRWWRRCGLHGPDASLS